MTLVLWNFAILTDTQKKIQKGLTGMEAFNRIQRLAHAGEESELFSAEIFRFCANLVNVLRMGLHKFFC